MRLYFKTEKYWENRFPNMCFSYFIYFLLYPFILWHILPFTIGVLIAQVIALLFTLRIKPKKNETE